MRRFKVAASLVAITTLALLVFTAMQVDRAPTAIEIVVLALATIRTSLFVHNDSLAEPIRNLLIERIGPKLFPPDPDVPAVFAGAASPMTELVDCVRCLPFWAALAWVVFWAWLPVVATAAGLIWALAMLATWGICFIDRTWDAQ